MHLALDGRRFLLLGRGLFELGAHVANNTRGSFWDAQEIMVAWRKSEERLSGKIRSVYPKALNFLH